ncbi:hypothetical protein HK098_002310 [Nowakowskiella sp. JEL0407]|nr:hypothetical protein HK098_002310 [Nowakowskiella sp. JEL0407]
MSLDSLQMEELLADLSLSESESQHVEESNNSNYLTATNLASFQHNHCELYLNRQFHSARLFNGSNFDKGELTAARFRHGNNFENSVRDWLANEGTLLDVYYSHRTPSRFEDYFALIFSDLRPRMFLINTKFQSPTFTSSAHDSTIFGQFKPDFIEINVSQKAEDEIQFTWKIIDTKISKEAKSSHQVQITFYFLALCELFWENRREMVKMIRGELDLADDVGIDYCVVTLNNWKVFNATDATQEKRFKVTIEASLDGEIWLPAPRNTSKTPYISHPFPLLLLQPIMSDFITRQVPEIISKSEEDITWHYNQLCSSCEYRQRCSADVVNLKTVSLIPNLSLGDAFLLRSILDLPEQNLPKAKTEIEDLCRIFEPNNKNQSDIQALEKSHKSTFDRVRRILKVDNLYQSPVLRSVTDGTVEVIGQKCLILPKSEDVAVFFTVLIDPEYERIYTFAISAIETNTNGQQRCFFDESIVLNPESERHVANFDSIVHQHLTVLIRKLSDIKKYSDSLRVQFYTFGNEEVNAITKLIIDHACRNSDEINLDSEVETDDAVCIGALIDHSDALLTTIQPDLLGSGNLIGSIEKKKQKIIDYLRLFGGKDVDTTGTVAVLTERLQKCILEQSTMNHGLARNLPKIVSVYDSIRSTLALPTPGFYGISECAELLLHIDSQQAENLSSEAIFSAYQRGLYEDVMEFGRKRTDIGYRLVKDVRKRVLGYCLRNKTPIESILVNDATDFRIVYLDICSNVLIRKLMFMVQFEMVSRMQKLAIQRSTDSKIIELEYAGRGSKYYTHKFKIIQGSVYLNPPDNIESATLFEYLIVRQPNTIGTPSKINTDGSADLMFNDLKYSNVFQMKLGSTLETEDVSLKQNIAFAEVLEVVRDGDQLEVVLQLRMAKGFLLSGYRFKLRERFVDFNSKKLVKTLLEQQIQLNSLPRQSPPTQQPIFLQILSAPNAFGLNVSKDRRSIEVMLQMNRFYKEYYDLRGIGNRDRILHFHQSQMRAFRSIVEKRLNIIWGPPGHGKTHTLALSVLRLIEISFRKDSKVPYRVLVTAFTHAAINTFVAKLKKLLDAIRSIENMKSGEWRNDISIVKLKDNDRDGTGKYEIVCGTVWSIYKWKEKEGANQFFDVLVIDEGSQMPVSDSAIAFGALNPNSPNIKVIICGDHMQLPPILEAKYPTQQNENEPKLFVSILECLMRTADSTSPDILPQSSLSTETSTQSSQSASINTLSQSKFKSAPQNRQNSRQTFGPLTQMLTENFRMVDKLCQHSQKAYGGIFEVADVERQTEVQRELLRRLIEKLGSRGNELLADETGLPLQNAWGVLKKLAFGTNDENNTQESNEYTIPTFSGMFTVLLDGQTSLAASTFQTFEDHLQIEADAVVSLIYVLLQCFEKESYYVVTPHRSQRFAIKSLLSMVVDNWESRIRVDTVEKMQGGEADVVIACYGFADLWQ